MKVFYAMVLVLVAGAVPSHGRTESEGTLFNKTQPHESWNNVTVSSSKLETYDYLYLAMQWPRSFCNFLNIADRQCYQVPNRFTVHGLWPQLYRGRIDCTNRPIYYSLFDSRQLDRVLEPLLNFHWPDLTTGEGCNQRFWGTEFNKHGSCTFINQNDYFWHTITLVESLILNLSQFIRGDIFGKSNSSSDIRNAVYRFTNLMPNLRCIPVGGSIQLLEIRFCAYGIGNDIRLGNCRVSTDCGNAMIVIPPP